ncbi:MULTISPECIES: FAD-dependent monooxygenase [unclassified Rhizobium]|uniref:FAD-dependent monooxygenase n=1 Tax=unclassified Rhizobium TaxID=2613769 RepID=UPI001609C314|nr:MULTISPECIES: FAD-dependent monooxygenase [unclassified Rhizobium]MBB3543644.1 salicylate hydroxylase [Rhizobium sp. BK399]MCS3741884.1 salicylate hydroxylase [Rhizobium sp. BK661]MCS4095281.1 salicylate hydroxylase [Rhizobium sp. BK176]
MPAEHAAIVGAGVAGLTVALALARRGIHSEIFEQAPELTEVGAGLQISPNAAHILAELGILERLTDIWLEPDSIRLVSGTTLRQLAAVPAGGFARARWGAPYGVLHRASLQRALLDAVAKEPLCKLHLGAQIGRGTLSDVSGGPGDLLIGADGVWSQVRESIDGAPSPRFSGNIAYRFTIDAANAPAFLEPTSVSAFLGPSAHLVCYPLSETNGFNMVAITTGNAVSHDWTTRPTESQRQQLLSRFSRWHPAMTRIFADARGMTFWPLYETTDGRWQNGRDSVLIGDAAHAMMPFAAQGAAMAIEDAYELAMFVAARPVAEALQLFETHRAPRIARLRKRGAFNQFAYHARGPIRVGRDIVLGLRPPQSLAADLDWIYGYRAGT